MVGRESFGLVCDSNAFPSRDRFGGGGVVKTSLENEKRVLQVQKQTTG